MKKIYADYAAATPTDECVAKAMRPYMGKIFGNPSSVHSFGQESHTALEQSRQTVAKFLNRLETEVVFTSSGTESNNLALIGVAKALRYKGQHIITSKIEHPSVLNACRSLEKEGWQITYLSVNNKGLIDKQQLEDSITDQTILVSVHLANSEIGVVQDIATLARIASKKSVYFHTDACQAAGYINLDVQALGVDLLTFNGGKIYGPKGVAVLFVRSGVEIFPIIFGGGQERSLRSGTDNLPGIVGLAKATELVEQNRKVEGERIEILRDRLQSKLSELLGIKINVADSPRLPNHLSIQIENSKGNLVEKLDESGIAASSGSACSSRSLTDSHVLAAIGLSSKEIQSTVRLTLGRQTLPEDIVAIQAKISKLAEAFPANS